MVEMQKDLDRLRKHLIYVAILLLLTAVILSGMSIVSANRVAATAGEEAAKEATRVSEQKFCVLVLELRQGYREAPPATPAGRRQSDALEQLAGPPPLGIGCDSK